MQTEALTPYEQHLAERAAVAERRFGLALDAANTLAGWLTGGGGSTSAPWQVKRIKQYSGHDVIEVTNGHGIIQVHAGGYRQEHRLVAFVPTTRYVEFTPTDWDTVKVNVNDVATEATVNETKPALQIAKEFARKLGEVALDVADALDAEQARMLAERDKAQSVLAEFRAAGWLVREHNGTGRATVPEDHALRLLGVTGVKVDMETGGIDYDYRTYLPHDITAATLIGITLKG